MRREEGHEVKEEREQDTGTGDGRGLLNIL